MLIKYHLIYTSLAARTWLRRSVGMLLLCLVLRLRRQSRRRDRVGLGAWRAGVGACGCLATVRDFDWPDRVVVGTALITEELAGVNRVLEGLEGELGSQLVMLLTAQEIAAFAARFARLRSAGPFPAPRGDMPALPWPLL